MGAKPQKGAPYSRGEIWAKKRKPPNQDYLPTRQEMMSGHWNRYGRYKVADINRLLSEELAIEAADVIELTCDWCGKSRHDGECEESP